MLNSIKWKSVSISFENYLFLSKSQSSDKNNGSYTEKYQGHIPCSFAYKFVCVDNKFNKKVIPCRGKNAVYIFIEAILKRVWLL